MSLSRKTVVWAATVAILLLVLEVNTPADRLLKRMTGRASRVAWETLERLLLSIA